MSEAELMRAIQIVASKMGARLFRNNVGVYKIGKRYIRYGVCNPGGSDLIGWVDGRFLAVEVKLDTPTTKVQANFLKQVIKAGGVGIVAHSVEEFAIALAANT